MANYDGIMSFWRDRKKNKTYEIADAQARDDISSLATVASTGDYDDLLNKPTIPAAQVNADWNASSGVAEILNKPTIPTDADDISYDNTNSGLSASDVQDAIDEVVTDMSDKMDKVNPTGSGALSMNRKSNTTVGTNSTTLGENTTASNDNALASGYMTTASGSEAVAFGTLTTASGDGSLAEGSNTVASGLLSHAEGIFTKASSNYQHVSGKYNVEDANDVYAEIIGNGSSENTRSNARTLDWSGNEALKGDLTLFEGSANEMDVSTAIGAKADASSIPTALSDLSDDSTHRVVTDTEKSTWSGKQDALTAGTNISISNNTISATDTKPDSYYTNDSFTDVTDMATGGTWKECGQFQIAKGTWIVSVALQYPSNATGMRSVGMYIDSSSSLASDVTGIVYQQTLQAANGGATNIVLTQLLQVSATRYIHIMGRQTSGSAMGTTTSPIRIRARAIRILP